MKNIENYYNHTALITPNRCEAIDMFNDCLANREPYTVVYHEPAKFFTHN